MADTIEVSVNNTALRPIQCLLLTLVQEALYEALTHALDLCEFSDEAKLEQLFHLAGTRPVCSLVGRYLASLSDTLVDCRPLLQGLHAGTLSP